MSQKTGKRSRRPTVEETSSQSTAKSIKQPHKTDEEESTKVVADNNITEETNVNTNGVNGNGIQTVEDTTAQSTDTATTENAESKKDSPNKTSLEQHEEVVTNGKNDNEKSETLAKETTEETETNGVVEPENLDVEEDECPELVFDDNSDVDSEKSSPVVSRCMTRRSQMRNIPTPKTPKLDLEQQPPQQQQQQQQPEVDLNGTFESCESGASTKAEPGGDSTRMEYLGNSSEPSQFLMSTKDKSYVETLRTLSSRRTIRSVEDYRRKALHNKSDLNMSYGTRDSIESVSMGKKRKNSEEDEVEGSKKYRLDTSGFLSKFTSPLSNFKRSFSRSDIVSSTPKLTGYKDDKLVVEGEDKVVEERVGEKRWCSIM